ncbi:hypothetical protein VDG1235_2081 [Verrucomicrobiia bacterium DG1235]|nr:hypothetical protein VDG1235_2081 [Verrucomicrobiae bacterium DG1235]
MNISYQERNHWIAILIGVWALAYYFLKVLSLEGGLNADLDFFLPFIVKIIIYSSVAGAVLAIVNWALNKEKHVEKDEMDRMIELKGFRNAYWAVSGLLWVVVISALLNERFERMNPDAVPFETINLLIHSVFLVAWLGTLVGSITHVIHYRRGIA